MDNKNHLHLQIKAEKIILSNPLIPLFTFEHIKGKHTCRNAKMKQ